MLRKWILLMFRNQFMVAKIFKNIRLISKFKLTRDDLEKKDNTKKDQYLKKKLNNLKIKRYLKSIKLLPKKVKIDSTNILRAEQLTNKTSDLILQQKDIVRGNFEFSEN